MLQPSKSRSHDHLLVLEALVNFFSDAVHICTCSPCVLHVCDKPELIGSMVGVCD